MARPASGRVRHTADKYGLSLALRGWKYLLLLSAGRPESNQGQSSRGNTGREQPQKDRRLVNRTIDILMAKRPAGTASLGPQTCSGPDISNEIVHVTDGHRVLESPACEGAFAVRPK